MAIEMKSEHVECEIICVLILHLDYLKDFLSWKIVDRQKSAVTTEVVNNFKAFESLAVFLWHESWTCLGFG